MRKNLIIANASILLVFVLLEVVTRFFIGAETIPEIERMQLDSVLGWHWTPNYQTKVEYRGYTYELKISEQGLRNEMVVIPKPSGQQRIIALGDSVTAGFGVNLEDTFAKKLQKSLGIEVINAGVDDYSIEQELLWLERDGVGLEPTLVILGVYLNDSRPFAKSPQWVVTLNNLLLNRSAFYTYYYGLVLRQRTKRSEQSPTFRFRFQDPFEAGLWKTDTEALAQVIEAADGDFGLAWQQTENQRIQQSIDKMAALGDEYNFELFVVIFPVAVQVETEVELQWVDQPQRWLMDFAKAKGIDALDLLPILRNHANEELYIDQAHLAPHGHTVVAEAIHTALMTRQ